MNYQDFLEHVHTYINSQLTAGQTVTITPVTKNNGLVYDGLIIMDPLLNVSPTIYLNPYYHRYLNGVSLEDIYEDILSTYHDNLPKQDFDVTVFTDFSKAKERIVMKLINYKRNEQLLTQIPHIPYLDLALVFVCTVSEFMSEYATILIHHKHLALWNIDIDTLYQIAMNNTPVLLPYRLDSMQLLLSQLPEDTYPYLENIDMYVLTNQLKVHGAACIAYPNLLEELSILLDSDLIIIPSSIHETLIVPQKSVQLDTDPQKLKEMILEANETQLTDDEILGDCPYLYTRETQSINFYEP